MTGVTGRRAEAGGRRTRPPCIAADNAAACTIERMEREKLGDSYDVVKRTLLAWLRPFGEWGVHPMFTDGVSVADYERMIGARVIYSDVIGHDGRVSATRSFNENLFLDPDTGLTHERTRDPRKVSVDEFRDIAFRAPAFLTVIFDHGFSRSATASQRRQAMLAKLERLRNANVHAFAYCSHACFIIAGIDRTLVERARSRALVESGLPESRFLPWASEVRLPRRR